MKHLWNQRVASLRGDAVLRPAWQRTVFTTEHNKTCLEKENVGAVSTVTADVIQSIWTCCAMHCWQGCNSLSPATLVGVARESYVSSWVVWDQESGDLSLTHTDTHTPLLHRRALVAASANVLHVVLCVYNSRRLYNRWGTWSHRLVKNRLVQPLCPSTQPVCLWWRQWRRGQML
jgi:hypothetical protein